MRPKYRLEIFTSFNGAMSRDEYMAHIVSTRNGEVLWRQSETYVKKEHCLRVAKGVLGLNDAVLERTDIVVKDLTK